MARTSYTRYLMFAVGIQKIIMDSALRFDSFLWWNKKWIALSRPFTVTVTVRWVTVSSCTMYNVGEAVWSKHQSYVFTAKATSLHFKFKNQDYLLQMCRTFVARILSLNSNLSWSEWKIGTISHCLPVYATVQSIWWDQFDNSFTLHGNITTNGFEWAENGNSFKQWSRNYGCNAFWVVFE